MITNNTIQHFNRILLGRQVVLLVLFSLALVVTPTGISPRIPKWETVEFRLCLFSSATSIGDALAVILLPPMRPSAGKLLEKFCAIAGI